MDERGDADWLTLKPVKSEIDLPTEYWRPDAWDVDQIPLGRRSHGNAPYQLL